MNPNHYPPEPLHYQAPNHVEIDGRPAQLTTLHVMLAWGLIDYWLVSVVVHILRAGAKDGESRSGALANAFTCFAKWFQFHGYKAPFYSAELDRLNGEIGDYRTESMEGGEIAGELTMRVADLRTENARLQSRIAELESELTRIRTMAERVEVFQDELADATVARIRTVAPALGTVAVEWTNDELEAWVIAKHGQPERPNEWRKCWNWLGDANRWTLVRAHGCTHANGWHGHAIGNPTRALTATEAARILNATKPGSAP
jgi:hypothetical protein